MPHGFDGNLLLTLNLAGTFAFGVTGALAAVRDRLDLFGALLLAAVVGLAGGIVRDVLIGIRPVALRDWRYLAAVVAASAAVVLLHSRLEYSRRPVEIADAAGLSLFCVTGALAGLAHRFAAPEAIALGLLSGVGGGILRDLMLVRVPVILRRDLYAVPALIGATTVVVAYRLDARGVAFTVLAAAACFALRLAGLRYGIDLPQAGTLRPPKDEAPGEGRR